MASAAAPVASMRVTVVWSDGPRHVGQAHVDLAHGATLADALAACRGVGGFAAQWDDDAGVGIWGRKAPLEQPLRAGDRVEIYRALRVDPKLARRERFDAQGSRAAGLFARRRAGAKAGY